MATTIATQADNHTEEKRKAGDVPLVPREAVVRDRAHAVSQHFRVTWPAEMTMQDLADPGVWKKVLSNRAMSFAFADTLCIVAHDESWLVPSAVVVAVDGESMQLENIKPIRVDRRVGKLPQSDKYTVKAYQGGYGVFDNRDNILVGGVSYSTLTGATAAMALLAEDVKRVA